jgi:hypothetical protein
MMFVKYLAYSKSEKRGGERDRMILPKWSAGFCLIVLLTPGGFWDEKGFPFVHLFWPCLQPGGTLASG